MMKNPETYGTPEGFDNRYDFMRAVTHAFSPVILEYSNGYPLHGVKFGGRLMYFLFALLECPFDGTPSKYFNVPLSNRRDNNQHATYVLAEFLATAKAKGHGEDDRHLKPIYDFMKLLGIPIIEYRDKVDPIIETLDENELAQWKREQAEATPAPATSDDLTRPWARR